MKGYYIQLFSPHGLIRFNNPEIGRDKDTGGQVKYVLELLENLSKHPRVRKVDLFTRRIVDKRVSTSYEKEIEVIDLILLSGSLIFPVLILWGRR